MQDTVFRLSVPADPHAVRVVRSVASAAAANAEMPFDLLDDLALAIDESCSALLEHNRDGALDTTATATDGGMQLAISVDGPQVGDLAWPPENWAESLNALVLIAVASNVVFDTIDSRPGISFTVG